MDEQSLIERYFVRPADADVVVGIGDDAAVLACDARAEVSGGQYLVVTADTLVEGRHFSVGADANEVGHKALAASLSDTAAMGATPRWATLCLCLPGADEAGTERWIARFARGFFALARRWEVALVGGDLVRGSSRTVSVQLVGVVDASRVLLRSGACPGDGVYVTGAVGDAGVAWRRSDALPVMPAGVADGCRARLHRPEPRVEEGKALSCFASAAIDVSDGLLLDLSRLARASGVAVRLEVEQVPLGEACRLICRKLEDWSLPLTGGDDHELLFTMKDDRRVALERALGGQSATVTRIGRVIDEGGECLQCTFEGRHWPLPDPLGFDHFAC